MLTYLGQALREAREEAGVTLRTVSIASDVTESNLSRIERGILENWPRKLNDVMAGYATALNTPASELWSRALEKMTASEAAEALSAARRGSRGKRRPRD